MNLNSNNPLLNNKRIVVKVGSALITDPRKAAVKKQWLASLARDIAALRKAKKEVIIVTSGAVVIGRKILGLKKKTLTLAERQAAAACGQIHLISAWHHALALHEIKIAEMLLTYDDSEYRKRYINVRNTLDTLLKAGITPVINENDTVALAELRVGDNDRLAARVGQMTNASMLVLLSDIDGLYTADPTKNPDAKHIPEVDEITPVIQSMAGTSRSHTSSGGMRTKIEAAKIATSSGCHMIICEGHQLSPLKALMNGGKHTHFHAHEVPLSARKHWIVGTLVPFGTIVIDDGAVTALESGNSLLPKGVVEVNGEFARGDAVWIETAHGKPIAKGLSSYNSEDALRIMGRHSNDIKKLLGYKARDVLIHRDDMVMLT